jgi:imidazolonepropionase-like amidohydrolase
VVAPGARADLIALDGDPLANISVLDGDGEHLALIIKDGVFFRRLV